MRPSLSPFVYFFCGLMCLILGLPLHAQQTIDNHRTIRNLEKSLEEVLRLSHCPGMAVAVVQKDKIIYAKGFGYRDYENKSPVTAHTLFPIGSCTKAFTAALIGQLKDEGKLSLDENPREYLPELSFYNDEMNRFITIRDMLCHRTGLPRHDMSWYLFPSQSRDSLIRRIRYHQPTLDVRQGYQYNNFMYMASGALIERITGQSWEENVISRFFAPLGMNHTNINIHELEQSNDKALGYEWAEGATFKQLDYYPIRGMAPAGSINSSVMDMGHWLIAWINGGMYDGKQIIPGDYAREAISSQVVASGRLPGGEHPDLHFSNYGLGWDLSSYRGHYRVEHGGNIDGFSTSTCFFPADSIGIVVLVNRNFSSLPGKVRNIIADKMLGLPGGDWYAELKKSGSAKNEEHEETVSAVSNRITGTRYSHPLQSYQGTFHHQGYGRFKITAQHDSLFAVLPENRWWLRHNHYDVFEPFEIKNGSMDTSGSSALRLNFHSNIRGEVDGVYMNIEQDLEPLFFEREPEEVVLDADELARYTGHYNMGGATAKVFVNDQNKLMLYVPGQPEYTLIASKKHTFTIQDLDGYGLEFEENKGNITAILFIQPNGTFRVPKE